VSIEVFSAVIATIAAIFAALAWWANARSADAAEVSARAAKVSAESAAASLRDAIDSRRSALVREVEIQANRVLSKSFEAEDASIDLSSLVSDQYSSVHKQIRNSLQQDFVGVLEHRKFATDIIGATRDNREDAHATLLAKTDDDLSSTLARLSSSEIHIQRKVTKWREQAAGLARRIAPPSG
jgi:hypothetical protein